MRKGQWRSLFSLARYEERSMGTKEYAKLKPDLRTHLELCGRDRIDHARRAACPSPWTKESLPSDPEHFSIGSMQNAPFC